ncbi:hypothetical protein PhaeoP97_02191 [Phaeobacter porticola]|uniref:Uncharacterized protein n=1 Tax=Phaeobacter porticola TaxID=1844006 RepID=A0A1L3I654_9RHOB|nr:hypothetical protein PhaeoP97_02191 [Phaeobacter porticola]
MQLPRSTVPSGLACCQIDAPVIGAVANDDAVQLRFYIGTESLPWGANGAGDIFGAVHFVFLRHLADPLDQGAIRGRNNGGIDCMVAVIGAVLGFDRAILVGQQAVQPPMAAQPFGQAAGHNPDVAFAVYPVIERIKITASDTRQVLRIFQSAGCKIILTLETLRRVWGKAPRLLPGRFLRLASIASQAGLYLSRFDAGPLIAFTAPKETRYGHEPDGRIPS